MKYHLQAPANRQGCTHSTRRASNKMRLVMARDSVARTLPGVRRV